MASFVQLSAKRPRAEMERGTYFVQTWGCQMNEEDSEQMALYLESLGLRRVDLVQSAQVVILNTCSVRKKPEDKAFSFMGQIAQLKKESPDIVIGVAGCMAQLRADEIRRRAPHVDFVVGTAQVAMIPGLVRDALQTRRFQKRMELPPRRGAVVTDIPQREVATEAKLKAYVPIQYGCDKFCTFCIVPTTRGRERSRPVADILAEVATLASRGTREVTLLGQTVNSYGKNLAEGQVPFGELLLKIAETPDLARIRYTSPYPRDFKTDLIEVIRDCPKVMEHLHMPLQSGSDAVLRRMKRIYTTEEFRRIVVETRSAMPYAGITTDIIVGFPGESDDEFDETLEFVRDIEFDGAYMFHYSIRPGTPAATMEQVPQALKMERLHRLIDLQNEISTRRNRSEVGRTLEVLVEGPAHKVSGMLQGYSREFRMTHFEGRPELRGQIVLVEVTEGHQWGVFGRLVEA